ncbi:MAG TPA: hypothetical protein VH682_23535 [Gemmataceae bacterium]|jgi:hypothetical protein
MITFRLVLEEKWSPKTAVGALHPLFSFYAWKLLPMNRSSAPSGEVGQTLRVVPAHAQAGKQADQDFSAGNAGAAGKDCATETQREDCFERMVE